MQIIINSLVLLVSIFLVVLSVLNFRKFIKKLKGVIIKCQSPEN